MANDKWPDNKSQVLFTLLQGVCVNARTILIRLMVGLVFLSVAAPVAAQEPGALLGREQTKSLFASSLRNEAAPAAQGSDTPLMIRGVAGGVFCCDGTGFILGGGVGARPFNNRQIEVAGDFSFLRFEGGNGVYIGANGYYHFNTDERFSPFAGAGLGILNIFDDTEVRFQIAGGLEFNADKPNPIRPEVRFVFTEGDVTTILMVSIGIARR